LILASQKILQGTCAKDTETGVDMFDIINAVTNVLSCNIEGQFFDKSQSSPPIT
jgi:hypothetical protein